MVHVHVFKKFLCFLKQDIKKKRNKNRSRGQGIKNGELWITSNNKKLHTLTTIFYQKQVTNLLYKISQNNNDITGNPG